MADVIVYPSHGYPQKFADQTTHFVPVVASTFDADGPIVYNKFNIPERLADNGDGTYATIITTSTSATDKIVTENGIAQRYFDQSDGTYSRVVATQTLGGTDKYVYNKNGLLEVYVDLTDGTYAQLVGSGTADTFITNEYGVTIGYDASSGYAVAVLNGLIPAYTFAANFLDAPGKIPGFSYTRATVGAMVQQYDGSFVQPAISEIPMAGGRRVRNLFMSSATLATQTVTIASGATAIISFKGTGTITFSVGATGTLVGTGADDRVYVSKTATGNITCTVSGTITDAQFELARTGQTLPSEYVSNGVLSSPYHGFGVDGVKWFSTDQDGVDLTSASSGYSVRCTGMERRPAITNLFPYSNAPFSWLSSTGVVRENAVTTLLNRSFARLTPTATTSLHYALDQTVSMTSGTTYTSQLKIKAEGAQYVQLTFTSGTHGTGQYANFNLSTGAFGTTSGLTVTSELLGGGVYLLSVSAVASITALGGLVILPISSGTDTRNPTLTMTGSETLLIADVQIETGAVANDYVPTTTTAVTVNAEEPALDPTTIGYDQDGGVWAFEVTPKVAGTVGSQTVFTAQTDANNAITLTNGGSSGVPRLSVVNSSVAQATIDGSVAWTAGATTIIAIRAEVDDFDLIIDGDIEGSDTGGTVPAVTTITLGGGEAISFRRIYYWGPA